MSIVYRKGIKLDGSNPALIYGYGSYGNTIDPYFSSARLSLLDRGFVFAIAHVRGGQFLGRQWYEDGKLLHKKNTFTDFITCSKYLIQQGYTSSDKLFAEGGSAGGLLMGAIANIEPNIYKGIIAEVPFVDVVTTMLDESIPLTTGEFDEWGNPKIKEYYDYMFGGSVNIPSYDEPLQMVGGDNNAFTNNDLTNYYITLPKENIETAFWLESDRMLSLAFSPKSLTVQKNVVIEEFNQRYLNQPYGDVWLMLRPLAYKVHPYQWATIGKSVDHIKNATLDDVKKFFFSHYAPNNAILSVVGNVVAEEVFTLAEKWFGPIEHRPIKTRTLAEEPEQKKARRLSVNRDVPYSSIYMANLLSRGHISTELR